MALVFGLDSGGTKTLAALADENGSVLALQSGPGLDPTAASDWRADLRALFRTLPCGEIRAAAFGFPYHDEVPRHTAAQIEAARALVPGEPLVRNDTRIAFDGAMAGAPGVLVLAGTGSMAWASRNGADDPHIRVGGWGDAFGDEGSAFWIGREALGLVSRSLDGRDDAPAFTDGLLALLDVRAEALIDWVYRAENRRAAIAGVSALVSKLAESGDGHARILLEGAAGQLAAHASAAWAQAGGEGAPRWSYAGGVMRSRIVRERIAERLGAPPLEPVLPPVGGALWRAAERAGWDRSRAWTERLAASLAEKINQREHRETVS